MIIFYSFNPFTAMLIAHSLRKWPIKVPILKSLRTFFTFIWAHEKIFVKMHSTQSRFFFYRTIRHAVCRHVCVHFSARKCCGWGSEGVKDTLLQDLKHADRAQSLTGRRRWGQTCWQSPVLDRKKMRTNMLTEPSPWQEEDEDNRNEQSGS